MTASVPTARRVIARPKAVAISSSRSIFQLLEHASGRLVSRPYGLGVLLLALLAFLPALPASAQGILPAFGRDRAGTVGFQFLKVPTDARSIGLSQSVVTTAEDASSLLYNPALAARAGGLSLNLSRASHFEGTLFTTSYAGLLVPAGPVVIGLSIQSLDSDEMDVTTEFQPTGTGQTFRFVDLAAGLTVSQSLTDLFSYGVTVRYIRESVFELTTQTATVDLGIAYDVGSTGARIGVAIRNFGLDATPSGEISRVDPNAPGGVATTDDFESITPPTTFLLGLSYDLMRSSPDHAVTIASQLYRPNDNTETLGLAAEYTFKGLLILRGGYRLGVEEYRGSLGAGLRIPGLGEDARVDYGYQSMEFLGDVHAFSLNVTL